MKGLFTILAALLLLSLRPAPAPVVTKTYVVTTTAEAKQTIDYETRMDYRVASMVSQCIGGKCSILIVLEK